MDLAAEFGHIDIYLFDQLLRRRLTPSDRVVDVGCGPGRNLTYLLRQGFDVWGLDADPRAIHELRALAARLAPTVPEDRFRVESVERSTLPDGCATVAISSAVLHFAPDHAAFDAMLAGTWRLVAAGGLLFCRLASTIGIETRIRPLAPGRDPDPADAAEAVPPGRYRLPDGSDRYLVTEKLLLAYTQRLGAQLLDPIKTTVVQDQRAMTTWVLRKSPPNL